MQRSIDFEAIQKILEENPELCNYSHDFKEWTADGANVALEEDGSFGLFTHEYPGVYAGHYFFKSHRGKAAIVLAKAMLAEMFKSYDAQAIIGLTPVQHKAAEWMSRQLGFKCQGTFTIDARDFNLFVLNKGSAK